MCFEKKYAASRLFNDKRRKHYEHPESESVHLKLKEWS